MTKDHTKHPYPPGHYKHIKKERITEWQVGWLTGSKDSREQIPAFLEEHAGI